MMKITTLIATAGLTLVSVSAIAHDPKEHQKEAAQSADCAKLKDMDMSKMDMNDPVVKALHQKCEAQMHHEHGDSNKHSEADHAASAEGAKSSTAPAAQKQPSAH